MATNADRTTLRTIFALAAVALASLLLVQNASGRAHRTSGAAATTIQVRGGEFFFKLSTKSIAKPGTVTFVFRNVGTLPHDLKIGGKQTPLTQAGKTARLVVAFKKKGKYPYLCTVPGHAVAGMKGVFTVR
jgi:uncharacterized cupredoxin-like copper-binding protein